MKPLVSVLIVEPSEIIFEGLKAMLEEAGGYNVLAPMHEASSLEDRLPAVRPDMLIVNPTLMSSTPRMQMFAWRQHCPDMPIVALVYQYVENSLMELFSDVIDIRCNRSALVATLRGAKEKMSEGEGDNNDSQENYELSDRETDVLVLVAKGLSSKEIADRLNISVHTVNSHRKNITHKTGIKSVAGLAVYAMLHNLMDS